MPKEQKEEVRKDIKKYAAMEAVANTEGGRDLIGALKKDCIGAIDTLCSKYKTASSIEILAVIASLAERLALYRTLTRAGKNKRGAAKELDMLLEEEPDDTEDRN